MYRVQAGFFHQRARKFLPRSTFPKGSPPTHVNAICFTPSVAIPEEPVPPDRVNSGGNRPRDSRSEF